MLRYQRTIETLVQTKDFEYGICVNCYEPIAPERLSQHPEVIWCFDCATKYEKEKKAQKNNPWKLALK